jgi:hypothetical protein
LCHFCAMEPLVMARRGSKLFGGAAILRMRLLPSYGNLRGLEFAPVLLQKGAAMTKPVKQINTGG